MEAHEAKVQVEKEKTKRARVYERALGRLSIVIAGLLLLITILTAFFVNL